MMEMNHESNGGQEVQGGSEWLEKRDARGRLLFLYSPLRDAIRLRVKGEETEIDLHVLRQESLRVLLGAALPSDGPTR